MGWLLLFAVGVVVYFVVKSNSNTQQPPQRPSPKVDFTVNYKPFGTSPTGKENLKWLGPKEKLRVGKYNISSTMTYTSDGAPIESEASCIDIKLKIGAPVSEPKGSLGYYPQYSNISPDQRANYLTWLASGRRCDIHDIGYVFLFFYGLERRVIVDKSDFSPVILEVLHLIKRYPDSRSFQGYLTGFISYAVALTGIEKLTEQAFTSIFVNGISVQTEDSLSIYLAWLNLKNRPLPGVLAYEVARNDSRSSRSVVLKRIPEQHQKLFLQKYTARYGEGIILKVSKKPFSLDYRPASLSLLQRSIGRTLPTLSIPHVLGIPSQFKGVVKIWQECINELKKVSTHVGKGLELTSREAYENLPEELRSDYDHPDKAIWDQVVEKYTENHGYAKIPVSELAQLREIPIRKKLTRKQSLDIANAAKLINYALVPDPWSIQRPYNWDEKIALLPSDGVIDEESDNYYHAAALMLELGIGMAAADGHLDREEVIHISRMMREQFRLPREYARRLEVFRDILIKTPPSLTGLGKRIRDILAPDRRQFLGHYLVSVAAVDGVIDPAERKALKAVYKAMELPVQELEALLEKIEVKSSEPAVIQPAQPGTKGETIPQKKPQITLNMELIKEINKDTAAVAAMIGQAMGEYEEVEEGEEPDVTKPITTTVSDNDRFSSLDVRYKTALSELIENTSLSKDHLASIARRHELMPAGMIDAINEWADETLGDYLIEGDGPYTIQKQLLEN